MKEQDLLGLSIMTDLKAVAEQHKIELERIFKNKINGYFLADIERKVMEQLGFQGLMQYYDFHWSNERAITGLEEAAEYDICRMIVGTHRAHSVFLSDDEIRRNEKSKRYKSQLVSEIMEKIQIRSYASVNFRRKSLFQGEEFLYYSLPYELFAMSIKMNEMLADKQSLDCWQLYDGVIYNGVSALTLLEDNLLGTAYPLCRGAIEMYLKLLILNTREKAYNYYEKFREFEIEQSCTQQYPEKFNELFAKRSFQKAQISRSEYLHFGWVDIIDEYHSIVKVAPYSVYGIISFLKNKEASKVLELDWLENLYKACHAYTHGSIQISRYPLLHYFEISIMLYYIIRGTFLLLCKEETVINGNDIISMIDRDFKILYEQYQMRSTEYFEKYYASRTVLK